MEGGAADRNHSGEGQGGTHTTGNHRGEGGADRNHSGEGQGGTHTTGNHRWDTMGWGGGRGGLAALHHICSIYFGLKKRGVYTGTLRPKYMLIIQVHGALRP